MVRASVGLAVGPAVVGLVVGSAVVGLAVGDSVEITTIFVVESVGLNVEMNRLLLICVVYVVGLCVGAACIIKWTSHLVLWGSATSRMISHDRLISFALQTGTVGDWVGLAVGFSVGATVTKLDGGLAVGSLLGCGVAHSPQNMGHIPALASLSHQLIQRCSSRKAISGHLTGLSGTIQHGVGDPVGDPVGLWVVGEREGPAVGPTVGASVGCPVGPWLGEPEGLAEGLTEGLRVGLKEVGFADGLVEGPAVGVLEGVVVGVPEGAVVGVPEGVADGPAVGLAVGISVLHTPHETGHIQLKMDRFWPRKVIMSSTSHPSLPCTTPSQIWSPSSDMASSSASQRPG
jgi:hypothetical protein